MKRLLIMLVLFPLPAFAQQLPLTEWRAQLDADLARLSMSRDAHMAVMQILQAYEKQAQQQAQAQPLSKSGHTSPLPTIPQKEGVQ
jgi:hypothetical protein